MRLRSFRLRLLLGSVLWTLGLLYVAHMASLALIRHFDGRGVIHVVRIHPDRGAAGMEDSSAAGELRKKLRDAQQAGSVTGGVLAAVFMLAGLWIVTKGMRSLRELHARVGDVRDGRHRRVEGEYPSEVQPLVNDLNALLGHGESLIERAQAKAGDLAHGLKTPLALLAQEAERAAAAGQVELSTNVAQLVERMRRQIDYHLAQARAAASGSSVGAHTLVSTSVEGITRALDRLHGERGIAIRVEVGASHAARVERQDLDEMLGNLMENACQWARAEVVVASTQQEGWTVIDVGDDGPGIEPSMREAVLRRGVRADEAAPGTGLGLAIVRDLAELYGGSISLGRSAAGGLRARLTLPA